MTKRSSITLLATLATVAATSLAWGYEADPPNTNAIAGTMSSTSFVMSVSTVTYGGSIGVCPAGRATTIGFWSRMGHGAIPIRLSVDRGPTEDDVRLDWTGQADAFEIFRSTSPVRLTEPVNRWTGTGQCSTVDAEAAPFDILFYRIERAGS